ncbi:Sulfide:quinone oxidoreductase, mitochondrial [Seminavis robusta]|uniref:Sulfide:quinone oxidoreductase, mitochondrial n=1 Tax=Seminavis robusta TaxID=568900 RepID=A0A9N8EFV9_9STRA|nr:Sulfide:quinone oxidoreductase, mitochondrial [Seminavis robusta]|eukprot:Sro1018_g231920.1 Sulfide:quinone oxidoreductase, mitochondrial (380) ;mRNA; f:38094-39233
MFRFVSKNRNAILAGTGATVMGGYLFLRPKQHPDRIVIVGGGTGGIGVAAMLRNEGMKNVTLIEPKDVHYYQPLWTLCGGGVKNVSESAKPMKDILPKGTNWVQNKVESFQPTENKITTADGKKIEYDYLVVAAGIETKFDQVPGLQEGLEGKDSGVVSIYDYNWADKTFKTFQRVSGSGAFGDKQKANYLFTFSPTVLKCAGAPQKIMWLLEDTLRSQGKRDQANITYWTPGGTMFGVKYYSDKLNKIREDRGVEAKFKQQLVKIDPENKVATFENVDTKEKVEQPFDMLHVAPHMYAPAFLQGSPFLMQRVLSTLTSTPCRAPSSPMYLHLETVPILQIRRQLLPSPAKLLSLSTTFEGRLKGRSSMVSTLAMTAVR